MKIVLLILFMSVALFSKSSQSCYTVQLTSTYNSQENLKILRKKSYDKSCKLMEIGESLAVRCGCFESFSKSLPSDV